MPEKILGTFLEDKDEVAKGGSVVGSCKKVAFMEQSDDRWRREYDGLKADRAGPTRSRREHLKEREANHKHVERLWRRE